MMTSLQNTSRGKFRTEVAHIYRRQALGGIRYVLLGDLVSPHSTSDTCAVEVVPKGTSCARHDVRSQSKLTCSPCLHAQDADNGEHEKAVDMTKQESFKKRVRSRMADTGERYMAARRVLLAEASQSSRTWAAHPETGDAATRSATGRGWDEWCDLIEATAVRERGHTAVAAWLQHDHGLTGWWAQSVTGGWERITGRRLPGEMPDGTFTVNKSKTVAVVPGELRELLLDEAARVDLFPGLATELRSKPDAKTIRLAIGPGVAQVAITAKDRDRATVAIQHSKLPTASAVDEWKFWWTEWLEALASQP